MNVIEVKELDKYFGKFKALNQVNLTVKQGEIHGFIGPNGAGKSTTIRVLLGMLKADAGVARIFGKDAWSDVVSIHKQIAYVPGESKLWPNLTGGEVIDLLHSMRGNSKIDQTKKEELINYFAFDPTKKCRAYSKGNMQKITIISAFLANPDLYILDEPTSGLDPLMERKFQNLLRKEKDQGKTILMSSHELAEVEKICDSISIIRNGTIIETGTLEELRHLTRMNIEVETEMEIAGLAEMEGVYSLKKNGNMFSFQVDSGRMDEVIKLLAHYPIRQFKSMSPTLEDLFLRYYETDEEAHSEKSGVND